MPAALAELPGMWLFVVDIPKMFREPDVLTNCLVTAIIVG